MSDIYFILFYGVIFIIVLYLILSMLRPSTIIVEQPPTVPLWPWPITSYNWWPYWYSGGSGGYSGTTRVYRSEGRPWGGASRMANGSGGGHHGGGHGGGRGGGGSHGGH